MGNVMLILSLCFCSVAKVCASDSLLSPKGVNFEGGLQLQNAAFLVFRNKIPFL